MDTLAPAALIILGAYLAIGALVGVPLVARGVDRIDPVMRTSPARVRLLILPGVIALWPLMLTKWIRTSRPVPAERHP